MNDSRTLLEYLRNLLVKDIFSMISLRISTYLSLYNSFTLSHIHSSLYLTCRTLRAHISLIYWSRNEVVFQLSDKLIFWFYEADREIKHLKHDRTKMIDESSTHDMIESKMTEHEELWMRKLNLRENEDLGLR
jgi:hypothetical protein